MMLIRWFKKQDRNGNSLPGAILSRIKINPVTRIVSSEEPRWRIEPVLAWYDLWIGVYVDREKRIVYVLPLPCIGFRFYWG